MQNKKEIESIIQRGFICVILVVCLSILGYFFIPIGIVSSDFDTNLNYDYKLVDTDNISYIFTLSGINVKLGDKIIINPRIAYSGKTNYIKTMVSNNKYCIVYPVSWKNLSLNEIKNKIVDFKNDNRYKVVKSISLTDIRQNYQKIDISNVVFYKTVGNINRLIYGNLDTYKIVIYSYRNEVVENELYWNVEDGYYYLICPEDAEQLFQNNPEYSEIDIV